jgi:uncharacterized protein YjiS (DUF1127 family)
MNKYLSAFVTAQKRRATLRQLTNMDDRMLADIGITREDLSTIMMGSSRKTAI